MKALPEYAWEKFFEAPKEALWHLWTDAELFSAWYGPNVSTVVHQMEAQRDGLGLVEMKWADNQSQFQKYQYLEVTPYDKLVWLQSMTDENWNTIRFSQMKKFPEYLLTTVSIEEELGRRCMRFTWVPYGDVTDEEVQCFKSAKLDMDASWRAGLVLFEDLLKEVEAALR